jgi:hypothetical protein
MAQDHARAVHAEVEAGRQRRASKAKRAAMTLADPSRVRSGSATSDSLSFAKAHSVTLEEDFTDAVTLIVQVSFGLVKFERELDGWDNRVYVRLADQLTPQQSPSWVPDPWPPYVTAGMDRRVALRVVEPVGRLLSVHLLARTGTRGEGTWEALNRDHPTPVELTNVTIDWLARCLGPSTG